MAQKAQPIWSASFTSAFFTTMLVFTAFYLLLPTLPLYLVTGLNVEPGYTGIVLATYTIAALLIRPATGYYLDIRGRKIIYLAGLIGFSVMFGGYLLATSLAAMLIVRFIHGFLWGITTTAGSTIAVDLVPVQRRGEGLGYFGLASTIPMAIGPFIGLQLIRGSNFNLLFLTSLFLGIIGLMVSFLIRYPEISHPPVPFVLKNLFEKTAIPVSMILFINMITYGGLVSFVSLYVKQTGIGDAGAFFFIYAIGITLARIASGKIFDRRGPDLLMMVAFVLIIAGFLILSLVNHQGGLLFSALLMGLGGGILFPVIQAMVNNMVLPSRRGAANSTLFTVLDLGIGTGMILTGYLAGVTGLNTAFLICSGLNIIALSIFLLHTRKHYTRHQVMS